MKLTEKEAIKRHNWCWNWLCRHPAVLAPDGESVLIKKEERDEKDTEVEDQGS